MTGYPELCIVFSGAYMLSRPYPKLHPVDADGVFLICLSHRSRFPL
jgi:hypothetical protein